MSSLSIFFHRLWEFVGNLGPAQATGGENICLIRGLPALFPTKSMILRGPLNSFTSSAEMNSACGKVLPPSGGKTLGRRICGGTKSTILRRPRSGDWRGNAFLTPGLPAPPSRGCSRHQTAYASSEQSPLAFVSACGETYDRSLAPPLPTKFIILRGPHPGDWRGKHLPYSRPSSSSIQRLFTASLGMRQSPRGLRATEPTLGPSARQERLNCWEKKRR